jgi:hypothetical protein
MPCLQQLSESPYDQEVEGLDAFAGFSPGSRAAIGVTRRLVLCNRATGDAF